MENVKKNYKKLVALNIQLGSISLAHLVLLQLVPHYLTQVNFSQNQLKPSEKSLTLVEN